jgi:tetratricopeptide (TPR) repeat protein
VLARAIPLVILAVSPVALAGGGKQAPAPSGKTPGAWMEPDDLPAPRPEVSADRARFDLPPVPDFALAIAEPGFHRPRELRVRGRPLLGTEIKVEGYVTWIYDCIAVLAAVNPDRTSTQIGDAIDRNPRLCAWPRFDLGDTRDSSREASIWVVEVPRPRSRTEPRQLTGGVAAPAAAPAISVGDPVAVTGTWATYSPHAGHNTGGLLIYKAIEHVAPSAVPSAAPHAATSPAPVASEPEIAVVTAVPLRRLISNPVRNASIDHLNACNKAIAARRYDAGIAECRAAVEVWGDNHLAWYAWASAHIARGEWQKAAEVVEHAVALRPDHGMYQLYLGIALYEAERERVRDEQARQEHRKPDDVVLDPSRLKLDAAHDALRRAVKLAPELWRAHYYLGRVYRELDDARREAEQFTATIATHPRHVPGYIALIELYRRWEYLDQALAAARLGLAHVPAAEAGELWFEVGMVYDARHASDGAIEAFGQAIAANPDDLSSKFQRGQIYFRRRDHAGARRDLEPVASSSDPALAAVRPLAADMLAQMASRR